MSSKEILIGIKNESVFTCGQTLEAFLEGLCKRFARVFGEILPLVDYDYIVNRMRFRGLI